MKKQTQVSISRRKAIPAGKTNEKKLSKTGFHRIALMAMALFCCLGFTGCKKESEVVTLPTVQRQETTVPETTAVPETTKATEPVVTEETAPQTEAPTEETTADGLRPEFKQAMDSYESFYNEYVDLLNQYKANPTDFSILTKYMSMLSKLEEIDTAFKAWDSSNMTSEELKYYLEVSTRIQKKLVDLF